MSMKKADIEKAQGKKIAGGGFAGPDRYGKGSATAMDKREQRERDRELGLVPFAVKLHADLIREIHDLAQKRGIGMNELADELIRKGLKSK